MDLNIFGDLPSLKAGSGWSAWYRQNIIEAACSCPALSLNHDQLEALRSPSVIPGAQTCGATYEAACDGASCDNAARTPGLVAAGTSTCGSGIAEPSGRYSCSTPGPASSAMHEAPTVLVAVATAAFFSAW